MKAMLVQHEPSLLGFIRSLSYTKSLPRVSISTRLWWDSFVKVLQRFVYLYEEIIHELRGPWVAEVQSNFNGSNTFGTMKMCSRQGEFEALKVYFRARSGGIIWISCQFSSIWSYIVCSHQNRLNEAILMSTHNIPFLNVKNKIILNHPKSATMG